MVGTVDHGRQGGRSEKPPPVSSADARFRSASDQCFCPHVFFTTVAAGAFMLLLSIATLPSEAGYNPNEAGYNPNEAGCNPTGGVPREQKMLKGHRPRVIKHHQVY